MQWPPPLPRACRVRLVLACWRCGAAPLWGPRGFKSPAGACRLLGGPRPAQVRALSRSAPPVPRARCRGPRSAARFGVRPPPRRALLAVSVAPPGGQKGSPGGRFGGPGVPASGLLPSLWCLRRSFCVPAPLGPPCAPCGCYCGRGVLPCFSVRAAWVPLRGSQARCCCACRGVLPCFPPPCRPRWGLPGARGLRPWGLPPPRCAPPLTSGCGCAIMVHAWPVPLLFGAALDWVSMDGKRPLDRKAGRFFYARAFPSARAFSLLRFKGGQPPNRAPGRRFFCE